LAILATAMLLFFVINSPFIIYVINCITVSGIATLADHLLSCCVYCPLVIRCCSVECQTTTLNGHYSVRWVLVTLLSLLLYCSV